MVLEIRLFQGNFNQTPRHFYNEITAAAFCGGAVPYHWVRFRGIAQDKGLGDLNQRVLSNIHCDTYLYYYDSINFWFDVVPTKNIFYV